MKVNQQNIVLQSVLKFCQSHYRFQFFFSTNYRFLYTLFWHWNIDWSIFTQLNLQNEKLQTRSPQKPILHSLIDLIQSPNSPCTHYRTIPPSQLRRQSLDLLSSPHIHIRTAIQPATRTSIRTPLKPEETQSPSGPFRVLSGSLGRLRCAIPWPQLQDARHSSVAATSGYWWKAMRIPAGGRRWFKGRAIAARSS